MAKVELFFAWVLVLTRRSSGQLPAAAYLSSLGFRNFATRMPSPKVLCRGCYKHFPAPPSLADEDKVLCPDCGEDTHRILKDEVNNLLAVAREGAVRRAAQLPPLPRESLEALRGFWTEVRWAYMLHQYSASLLLGTSFLEFILTKLLGENRTFNLPSVITRCANKKLIDARMRDALKQINDQIRNKYAHGNYADIAGNAPIKVTLIKKLHGSAAKVHVSELRTQDAPLLQVIQKIRNDEAYANRVLNHVYNIASELIISNEILRRRLPTEA